MSYICELALRELRDAVCEYLDWISQPREEDDVYSFDRIVAAVEEARVALQRGAA